MNGNGIESDSCSHCRFSPFTLRLMSSLPVFVALLLHTPQQCVAWTASSRPSSVSRTMSSTNLRSTKMYIDNPNIRIHQDESSIFSSRRRHPAFLPQPTITVSNYNSGRTLPPQPKHQTTSKLNHTDMISSHGMPWTRSISEQFNIDHQATTGLFYMKFYEWQISFMHQELTNLKQLPLLSKKGQRDMSYIQNKNATMRMHTSAYSSDEYKYIRCTTVDGGNQMQVFTSLFYPRNTLLPVLGVDLLQFNHGKKTLCIVDFQPVLTPTPSADEAYINSDYYESKLKLIRDQYPTLQNEMTNRFYSADDPYFSKQMLLGRIQHDGKTSTIDETKTATDNMVHHDLFPAYQQYVQTHVQLQKEALKKQQQQQQQQQDGTVLDESFVKECHARYDTYSAERDPAHKLLGNIFGSDFANDYVYDILFPSATRNV